MPSKGKERMRQRDGKERENDFLLTSFDSNYYLVRLIKLKLNR